MAVSKTGIEFVGKYIRSTINAELVEAFLAHTRQAGVMDFASLKTACQLLIAHFNAFVAEFDDAHWAPADQPYYDSLQKNLLNVRGMIAEAAKKLNIKDRLSIPGQKQQRHVEAISEKEARFELKEAINGATELISKVAKFANETMPQLRPDQLSTAAPKDLNMFIGMLQVLIIRLERAETALPDSETKPARDLIAKARDLIISLTADIPTPMRIPDLPRAA